MLFLTDDIMTNVELPENFGLYGVDGDLEGECYEALSDMVQALWGEKWFSFKHGVSKVVITSIKGDYVYKFPFRGYYDIDNAYDDEPEFCEFCGGGGSDYTNYCDSEIAMLEDFDEEFLIMFPHTEEVKIKGVTCYKQERCICVTDTTGNMSIKPSKAVSEKNSKTQDFLEEWIGIVENYYGTEFTLRFLEFAYSSIGDDMHYGNYGYSKIDGRPVVIDWAGYYD